mgnify:FL=1
MIFCSYTMIVTIVLQQGAQMKRKPETKRLDPAAKEALQQFKCELSQELGTVLHSKTKVQRAEDSQSIGSYMVQQMIRSQKNKIDP